MLFAAFATLKPNHQGGPLIDKSTNWWTTDRPAGLTFRWAVNVIGAVPDVFVVETDDANDLHSMVHYWPEFDFVFHPAYDMLSHYRRQGMEIAE